MTSSEPATTFSPALVAVGVCFLGYAVSLVVLAAVSSGDIIEDGYARTPLVVSSIMTGVIYIAGLWSFRKHARINGRGLFAILLVGLAARCVVLVFPPFLEDDYHRYLLDGAVTANGLNPYSVIPDRLVAGDSASPQAGSLLAKIATEGRETIPRINHPHLATIYPPVAQVVFAAAYLIKPWSVYALRGVLFAFDVATFALLLTLLRNLKLPAGWVAWYWWNPVLLREVTSSAHMDVILFPFVLGAMLLALRGRAIFGSMALVAAIGTKLWPLLLAPVLLRAGSRRISQFFCALIILIAGSACVVWPIIAGAKAHEGGLIAFARYWRNNEGFFAIWSYAASAVLPHFSITGDDINRYTRFGLGLLVGCWAVWCAIKPIRDGSDLVARVLRVVAALYLLSPTQFPWYYLWMLPLLCVRLNLALVLYSATIPLYYLHYNHRFVIWFEHLPIWIVLIGMWLWGRKMKRLNADAWVS